MKRLTLKNRTHNIQQLKKNNKTVSQARARVPSVKDHVSTLFITSEIACACVRVCVHVCMRACVMCVCVMCVCVCV